MFAPKLYKELQCAVLNHLQVTHGKPDHQHLEQLVAAFVRIVPWESASRIVRRADCDQLENRPRWPDIFWNDHLRMGGGGTCFESNFAFSALLNGLGYEGYLTINDMQDSIGCHTAVILLLDGQKWIVDVGFPIYGVLPLNPEVIAQKDTPFHRYSIDPLGDGCYQIERRPHPNEYAFTLIDRPVTLDRYRQATTADYGPHGHFLQRVIVHKILNEQMWRFNSVEIPAQFSRFEDGRRFDTIIDGDIATAIAAKFHLDQQVVHKALELLPAATGQSTTGAAE